MKVRTNVALSLGGASIPKGLVALVESANRPRLVRKHGALWLESLDWQMKKVRLYGLNEEFSNEETNLGDGSLVRVVYVGLQKHWVHPLSGEVVLPASEEEDWAVHLVSSQLLRHPKHYDMCMTECLALLKLCPRGLKTELPPASFKDEIAYEYERKLFNMRSPYWE